MRPDLGSYQQRAEYFTRQLEDNETFFRRFGREPDYTNKRVLDLGCGDAALSVRMAARGAREVVSLDVDAERLDWARGYISERFPDIASRLRFVADELTAVEGPFDLILAKDTVEHLFDVAGTLRFVRQKLAPGGEAWLGFSPLYYSPFGDHGRTGMRIPWGHVLPWALVRRIASRHQNSMVTTLADLGLNGLTPGAFRGAARTAGLTVASIEYNRGDKALLHAMSRLRTVPGLERYMTVSVYTVLS